MIGPLLTATAAAAASLAVLACSPAQASMIGRTLSMQWYAPDAGTPLDTPFNRDVVVADGLEIDYVEPNSGAVLQIDLRDDRFIVTIGNADVPDEGFFGFALRDRDGEIAPITGLHWVTPKPTDQEPPWLSFDADTMVFNFAAIGLPSRRQEPGWRRSFETRVTFGAQQPLPAPGTAALIAGALGAVAWLRRRRSPRGRG